MKSSNKKYVWIAIIILTAILVANKNRIVLYVWDKISQMRINTLHPQIRQRVTDAINAIQSELGKYIRVTDAFRTFDEQAADYAQGRTTPGKIITHAGPGDSYHNYGLALDVVEIKDGKANYQVNYSELAKIFARYGFSWGGNWPEPKTDNPHFEDDFGYTVYELKDKLLSGDITTDGFVNLG